MNKELIQDTQKLIDFISEMTKVPFVIENITINQLVESLNYIQKEAQRILNLYVTGIKTEKDLALYDLLCSIHEKMAIYEKEYYEFHQSGHTLVELANFLYFYVMPNFITGLSNQFLIAKQTITELKI